MANDTAGEARRGVFGGIAGKIKQVAGAVTGNDELTEEGLLQQKEAEARKEAAARDAVAEQERREADAEYAARRPQVEQAKARVAVEEARKEAELEREREAAKAQVDAEIDRREDVVEQVGDAEQRRLAAQEAAAAREHAEDVADARRTEAMADVARARAEDLDAAAERQ